MKKQLKSLAAAIAALAVLGALLAAGAQAQTFTASSYPATGTGEQVGSNKFTIQGITTTCNKQHFEGSLTEAAHTITVTPTFKECTFGPLTEEWTMNGCDFDFTIADNSTVPPTTNSMHIKCPAGQTITWEAPAGPNPTCVLHIPEQTPTTNVIDYANNAGGILLTFTLGGIHSTTTDGFLCPLNSSTETDTGGVYTGTVQFNGTGGKTVDIG